MEVCTVFRPDHFILKMLTWHALFPAILSKLDQLMCMMNGVDRPLGANTHSFFPLDCGDSKIFPINET